MSPIVSLFPAPASRASRHRQDASTSGPTSRIEVCPPQLWPSSLTLWGRMQRWLIRGNRLLSPRERPANLLALVKAEFRQSLDGLRREVADPLAEQIERARSLRELWHLRSALYGRLAIDFSQSEAERRLSGLNRHFPTRSPRPFGAWATH